MGGVVGAIYLVEMPIVMESIQKNHSTPQQPILQGVWRGSTPESDLQCSPVSTDYRQARLVNTVEVN